MHSDGTATTLQQSIPIPKIAVPLLGLAAFASSMSIRVNDALLPRLSAEFGVSLGEASGVVTVFAIAYGLSQLFFGPVGDRYGKYFVIACACFASTATAIFCALAPNFALLLTARLLAGATAAAIIPLSMAWIGDVVPYQQRQPVLARFLIGQILGLSAGVLAGGLTADYFNWRLPYVFIALIFLSIGLVLLPLNRRLPEQARMRRHTETAMARRMIDEFGQILVRPWARVVLLTVFLEGAFLFGPFAFIPSHVHEVHGISLTAAGALVMLFGLGGLLFAMGARGFVMRLGEGGLALRGGILVAASLLAIGMAPVWWWAIPACFVAGLGFYMLHNTLQTNATQMAPERRGSAVSAFASCFFLGQSIGVAVTGAVVARTGTAAVLVMGALGMLTVAARFRNRLKLRS